MSSAIDNYTLPDVGGQRIELTPSVPEWVHELPVLNHPNDIRSLVRVVTCSVKKSTLILNLKVKSYFIYIMMVQLKKHIVN